MIITLLVAPLLLGTPVDAAPAPAPEPVQDPESGEIGEAPTWTGTVSLGLTYTDGNTEILSAAAGFDAERRSEWDRRTIRGFWNYAEQTVDGESDLTQRDMGMSAKHDFFVDDHLYYLGNAGWETDELANLDLRWYVGGGVGYQFIEDEKTKLSGEGGLVYFSEKFDEGGDEEYLALRGAYNFKRELSDTATFEQIAELFPGLEDIEDIYGKLDTRFRVSLTADMFAQLQWVMDYDNTPAEGAYRMDHRVILSLGWGF
jgi:putative salt-induced outer membrane protein YdiY